MPMEKSAGVEGWRCFQGESIGDVFPRAEALGCSVFALQAIKTSKLRAQVFCLRTRAACEGES